MMSRLIYLWNLLLCCLFPGLASGQLFNSPFTVKQSKMVPLQLNTIFKADDDDLVLLPKSISNAESPVREFRYCLPLKALKLTSSFGKRIHPVTGLPDEHRGVDLSARSEPIYSITEGVVSESGFHPILGNYIRIRQHEVELIYGHLSRVFVRTGAIVKSAEVIGWSGATGRVTGEHLHLSIKFRGSYIHPLYFLKGLMDQP